jgi:hypothetical protein
MLDVRLSGGGLIAGQEIVALLAGSGDVEQWFRAKPSSYSD